MKDLQKSLLIIFAINTESNFEDLLRILIKSGITIPVQMRPEARMWQLLFRLPEQCDLYLSNNELLAIFVELIPTKEAMFEKIIQEEEASLKNTLLAMKEESPFDFGCKPTDDIKIILIKKAKLQKGKCKESSIQLLNEAIQNHIEQYPQKKRVYESLEEYRPALYKATMEHGLFLTESTWNMIEKESQQEILQSLLALSLIDNNEYHFSTSRRYLMEEPDLWKNLLKISEQATAV